jgi:hypothetical protein
VKAGLVRRLIFVKVFDVTVQQPSDLFAINARRAPQFMTDVDVHALSILSLKDLHNDTGWGTVPTPVF